MKEKAIICDIDGVILDSSQVFKEIEEQGLTGDAKWEYFDRNANGPCVFSNKRMIEIIHNFYEKGYKIIFLSARSERIEKETAHRLMQEFLHYMKNVVNIFDFELLMRPEGDYSPSAEIKEKHLKDIKEKYDIICAFDDDDSNCEMFERNNILSFKVLGGKPAPINKNKIWCDAIDCATCAVADCPILELAALKRDYADCEREYNRMVQQYNAVIKQNEELQSALIQKCKDCDSDARLKLAEKDFEEIAKG